eukprot:15450901-Alexandrium_andersonii.AAC.1
MSFVAGLVPALRPHARALWGAAAKDSSDADGLLDRSAVTSGRARAPLLWIATRLLRTHGDLQKTYGLERNAPA